MVVLLAARRRRRVGLKERQDDIYAGGQLLGTLIRHALGLATLPQSALPVGVVLATFEGLLVPPSRSAQRHRTRGRAARLAAVAVPSVATPAEEEDLSAGQQAAHDEAKRVHVAGADGQELDVRRRTCDEEIVEPRPRRNGLRARSWHSGLSLFSGRDELVTATRSRGRLFGSAC
jgi:hypothetical protein